MASFRIYGEGPTLAYPSSADAAFVDATVKSLLDGDRTTAVVVDRARVLYLFLGRDPTDERGGWRRYVAEYVADGDDTPAASLAALERELTKLRLEGWGWECHPRDEAWLDTLGRATAASRSGTQVSLLARLADGGEPPLSFGMETADQAVGVATAVARTGASVAIVDGDGRPLTSADVVLRPGHDDDFAPLCERSKKLWEWKRDDAPSGGSEPDTIGRSGGVGERTPAPAVDAGEAGSDDTEAAVATDGGLAAVLGRATDGRPRPSITVPNGLTATVLALAVVVVAGLAVATTAVVGAGPFATDTGGSFDGGGGPGPAAATGTPTTTGSVVTLSASVTGTTVAVRGWGASGGLTVRLVDDTGETVANRRVEAGADGFRVEFAAPESGSYRVVARSDGTAVEEDVRVKAGADDAAFGLETPGRDTTIQSGTLRVDGRSPTESVTVRVTDATGTRVLRTNTSVSGGEFQTWITGLQDGQYTLTVTAAGERRVTRSVVFD